MPGTPSTPGTPGTPGTYGTGHYCRVLIIYLKSAQQIFVWMNERPILIENMHGQFARVFEVVEHVPSRLIQ